MRTFLNIFDRSKKKVAVLENAFSIIETQELNKIYSLKFSLPATDPKVSFCQPLFYARYGDTGQLYRIIKSTSDENTTSTITYECEHVIATLIDNVMFGSHSYGGGSDTTDKVITWILNQQAETNWRLGACDFARRFEYAWEQENLLSALYSVPKEFTAAYKWTFDTTTNPWTVNLQAINTSDHPEFYIRAKRNLLSQGVTQSNTEICTRIYALGYGEGVNQLTIEDAQVNRATGEADEVNGTKYGKTYIDAPASVIAQYGRIERVLIDRRYENATSLYSYAKTMLDNLQVPAYSRSFNVVDLYPITSTDIDNAEVGKIVRLTGDDSIAYITKTVRQLDDPGNLQIELSTKATDVASTIADLADRVRIESVYAQGATQLYQHSKDANATKDKGMIMSLYFPEEMRQINKVLLHLKLGPFRSYSSTTSSNGGFDQTYTVKESSQKYTVEASQNTYTVKESSQKYTVNASQDTYTVKESSQKYTVNASQDTYTVDASPMNIEAKLDKIATTDMSSDNGKDMTTSSGGSVQGSTSTSTTGGGTINVILSGTAVNTGNANWTKQADPYTNITEPTLTASSNGSGHGHSISGTTDSEDGDGEHTHTISAQNMSAGGGTHSHTVYDVTTEDGGHNHTISRINLQHNHTVDISVTSQTQGQTGFSHSHTFSVGSHTHTINIGHQHKYNLSHTHSISIPGHSHTITIPGHTHNITIPGHSHTITIPGHTHNITIPGHSHTITIPGHSHTITIPGHSHTITIPAHDHDIVAGIFESGNPKKFDIYIDNNKITTVNAKTYDGDITAWLLNNKNQVPRNSWINIEIRPDDLAYVQSSVFVQGFVQSRGGGNY